jgi:Skp family chaperone for outer membrane proteins
MKKKIKKELAAVRERADYAKQAVDRLNAELAATKAILNGARYRAEYIEKELAAVREARDTFEADLKRRDRQQRAPADAKVFDSILGRARARAREGSFDLAISELIAAIEALRA